MALVGGNKSRWLAAKYGVWLPVNMALVGGQNGRWVGAPPTARTSHGGVHAAEVPKELGLLLDLGAAETRVSLQLQYGFSTGVAAVGHGREELTAAIGILHGDCGCRPWPNSCNRDSP